MKLFLLVTIILLSTLLSACSVDSPDHPFIENRQLSAIDITTNALTLRWQPSTIRSSFPILYRPYYSLANNLYSINAIEQLGISANPPITVTTCRITGLDSGTLYYFNVISMANEQKSLHAPFAVYTAETNAPTAASNLRARMALKNSIKLLWSKGSDLTTPAEELSYRIYYSTNDNLTNVTATLANGTPASAWLLNKTNHTVTGLTPSTMYYFAVMTKDKWGNIAVSATKSRATPDSNNNFVINGNFSDGRNGWGYGWRPSTAGVGTPSNRLYCYTDNGGTGYSEAWMKQQIRWEPGDAAYGQYTIAPGIPATVIGFAYIKIQFFKRISAHDKPILATYQVDMHTGNQYSGIIWVKTAPAPEGTTHVYFQLGIYKSSGAGQMKVYSDNAQLSVLTNQ